MALVDDKYAYFKTVVAGNGSLNDLEISWYSMAATGTVVYNNVQVDGTFTSSGIDDNATTTQLTINNSNATFVGDVVISQAPNPTLTLTDTTNSNRCPIIATDSSLSFRCDADNVAGSSQIDFQIDGSQVLLLEAGGNLRIINTIELGSGGPTINVGSGTPEGVVTADVGSTFHRTDGGAGTSFYVKESGTGNTGWVGK